MTFVTSGTTKIYFVDKIVVNPNRHLKYPKRVSVCSRLINLRNVQNFCRWTSFLAEVERSPKRKNKNIRNSLRTYATLQYAWPKYFHARRRAIKLSGFGIKSLACQSVPFCSQKVYKLPEKSFFTRSFIVHRTRSTFLYRVPDAVLFVL